MHKTVPQTVALIEELKPLVSEATCEVVICPPFTNLQCACEAARGSNIKVGAQNVHFATEGAYTGEISTEMLTQLGVSHVIIGHSERREYFGETDATVNQRLLAAIAAGLIAILCVGETEIQREAGITDRVVRMQLERDLQEVRPEDMSRVIVAYEPIWAIGTGKTATAEQAQDVCAMIRKTIEEMYGNLIANDLTIQYGGSMKPSNAEELLSQQDIDGGLIGGAALKATEFAAIVAAAQ